MPSTCPILRWDSRYGQSANLSGPYTQRAIRKEPLTPASCMGSAMRHNVSRRTCLTGKKGHGTIRNDNLFRHGNIDVTASKTHERFAAGVHTALASKRMYTVCATRNVLGGYWVNLESAIRALCMCAPNSRSSNRVRAQIHCASPKELDILIERQKLRLAKDTLVVGPLLHDNASARSVGKELSAGTTTTLDTLVLAETSDMSMIAVRGTSTSKRSSVVSTETTRKYARAVIRYTPYLRSRRSPVSSF